MTPAFLVRVLLTALLLSCAALAAERSAAWYGRARRWIWIAAMGASVLLPFASRLTPPAVGRTAIVGRSAQIVAAFDPTPAVRAPQHAAAQRVAESAAIDVRGALTFAWFSLSLAMFAFVAFAYVSLRRVRARAARAEIDGVSVLTAERVGPAVVGILHPEIVVPQWVMDAPEEERRLIIMHEREHIDARDPWLLAFAMLATIAMPWNAVLWWQYRRLRLAIETDCDTRVLARSGNRDLYGRTLIRTASAHSALPMFAPAWGERASELTQRILAMTATPPRARIVLAATSIAFAAVFTLAACAATARPSDAHEPRPEPTETRVNIPGAPAFNASQERYRSAVAEWGLPGLGYARVRGYTREQLPTRVVLTGTGASLVAEPGQGTVRGDTLIATTPVLFHVVTKGAPNYRLVAYAVEPGTEVTIEGMMAFGGHPGGAAARGRAPALTYTPGALDSRGEIAPPPLVEPPGHVAPPVRIEPEDPPRPPALADRGTVRIESETGERVRVRVSSNISFRSRGAGVMTNQSDGTVEIMTPAVLTITGTGNFAMVFEPVDQTTGIRVSAIGREEDGFVRASAWSGSRALGPHGQAGAIALCSTAKVASGISGAARGTRAADVKCDGAR